MGICARGHIHVCVCVCVRASIWAYAGLKHFCYTNNSLICILSHPSSHLDICSLCVFYRNIFIFGHPFLLLFYRFKAAWHYISCYSFMSYKFSLIYRISFNYFGFIFSAICCSLYSVSERYFGKSSARISAWWWCLCLYFPFRFLGDNIKFSWKSN